MAMVSLAKTASALVKQIVRDPRYAGMLAIGSVISIPPNKLFCDTSDSEWFWLNTGGYRKWRFLRSILPAIPHEDIQSRFVGSSGDFTLQEGFDAYKLFKSLFEKHVRRLKNCRAILDFGCGWGRTIRFFLRDVDPTKLWGTDCNKEIIDICNETNKWCKFCVNNIVPPTCFPDKMFDLIYCYSVFSHLSEDAHRRWLVELHRILQPGGLLIATTFPREFIRWCDELRKNKNLPCEPRSRQQLSIVFLDTQQTLAKYDRGEFCFPEYDYDRDKNSLTVLEPVYQQKIDDVPFFGEACIPKTYVLRSWADQFTCIDFIDDRNCCPQNVIVVQKKSS
jgi:ubiquinone/menaquinone biosynthesis C-methylase UbiE